MASVGVCHSSVGVVVIRGQCGGCCPWALFVVGAGSSLVGTRSPCCGWEGCCLWAAVVIVGAGCSWALGRYSQILGSGACVWYPSFMGGRWLFVGGLFMDWVVVCGCGGALLCVVCHG